MTPTISHGVPVAVGDNRTNSSGLLSSAGAAHYPEFLYNEFFAGGTLNQGWVPSGNTGIPNPEKPLKTDLITIPANPQLKRRCIYGYIWARNLGGPFSYMFTQITLTRTQGGVVMRIPLVLTAGVMPVINVLAKSVPTFPLSGGLAQHDTIAFSLFGNDVTGPNGEPASVILQPFTVDTPCDKISVDFLSYGNFDTNQMRVLIATYAE